MTDIAGLVGRLRGAEFSGDWPLPGHEYRDLCSQAADALGRMDEQIKLLGVNSGHLLKRISEADGQIRREFKKLREANDTIAALRAENEKLQRTVGGYVIELAQTKAENKNLRDAPEEIVCADDGPGSVFLLIDRKMIWEIRKSPLHGIGLFAARDILTDELISYGGTTAHPRGTFDGTPYENLVCWDGDEDIMTWAPHMFINHSDTPNCECVDEGGMDHLFAIKDIPAGEELTIDYNMVCEYGFTAPSSQNQ